MTLNGEMALILRYFTDLVVSGAHCLKVVDNAITMGNFRLLCLVVTSAEGPRDAVCVCVCVCPDNNL